MFAKFVSKIQRFLILFCFLDTGNLVEGFNFKNTYINFIFFAFDGFNLSFSREEATNFHDEIVGKILLPYWQQFVEMAKDPCEMLHSIQHFSKNMEKFSAMEMFETLYEKIPISKLFLSFILIYFNVSRLECES